MLFDELSGEPTIGFNGWFANDLSDLVDFVLFRRQLGFQLVELGFITESEQYRRWVADLRAGMTCFPALRAAAKARFGITRNW